jgi:hypothetical protein
MQKRPVDVREQLSPEEFIHEYIHKNRPLIVTDALQSWPALTRWTPRYLCSALGDREVALTDDGGLDTVERMSLSRYCEHLEWASAYAGRPDGGIEDLRYLRLKDLESLAPINNDWSRPYFLPERRYLLPLNWRGEDPSRSHYPGFGVFVSPRGSATRLHVDGIRSNAVLCQVHGVKRLFMISPEQEPLLPDRQERQARRARRLSLERPLFGERVEVLEFDLLPGEVLFIPRLWFHEVHTLETSISITFNFVHFSEAPGFLWWYLRQTLLAPGDRTVG